MLVINSENEIRSRLEAIDIENGEYEFWDAEGANVSVQIAMQNVIVSPAQTGALSLRDAFMNYAKSQRLLPPDEDLSPIEVWSKFKTELQGRPRKKGLFSR